MSYEVELYPEESAFIDVVYEKRINQNDGRGDFIAPSVGPIIYLNDYEGMTESAIKFALLVLLNKVVYKVSGRKGMRFLNFTYQGDVPKVVIDENAKDLWGVHRMTVDERPLHKNTGIVIDEFVHEKTTSTSYKWDDNKKEYVSVTSHDLNYCNAQGFQIPTKLVTP